MNCLIRLLNADQGQMLYIFKNTESLMLTVLKFTVVGTIGTLLILLLLLFVLLFIAMHFVCLCFTTT